jgi:cytochrome c oxidase subunit 2
MSRRAPALRAALERARAGHPSRRRSPGRLGWRLGLVAAAAVGLGGCDSSLGVPNPESEQGQAIWDLWNPAVIAAFVVGSIVWTLIIVSVVRYRRRNDSLPTQVEEHIPIEVAYTVVPILIVIVLFFFGTFAWRDVAGTVEDPDEVVTVTGFQWSWRFTYDERDVVVSGDGAGTEGPELVLPVDRTTRLDLQSVDVNHAFWVPDMLIKRDLIQEVDNAIDVTPTEEGTYVGRCAEFCGLDHWRMYFQVRVVSVEEFEAWVADEGGTASEAAGEPGG